MNDLEIKVENMKRALIEARNLIQYIQYSDDCPAINDINIMEYDEVIALIDANL